jgi:hypothetical protein
MTQSFKAYRLRFVLAALLIAGFSHYAPAADLTAYSAAQAGGAAGSFTYGNGAALHIAGSAAGDVSHASVNQRGNSVTTSAGTGGGAIAGGGGFGHGGTVSGASYQGAASASTGHGHGHGD